MKATLFMLKSICYPQHQNTYKSASQLMMAVCLHIFLSVIQQLLKRKITYSYDNNNKNEQFTYDDLGNRITLNDRSGSDIVYTHNNVNEYTEVVVNSSTKVPLYDKAGNLTKDINDYTYHYDHENRLTQIKKNDDADEVVTYTYDALGRRIQVAEADPIGGATTRYYYDGQRVLVEEEDSGSGFADERYFVFGNYIDEVLIMVDEPADTPVGCC